MAHTIAICSLLKSLSLVIPRSTTQNLTNKAQVSNTYQLMHKKGICHLGMEEKITLIFIGIKSVGQITTLKHKRKYWKYNFSLTSQIAIIVICKRYVLYHSLHEHNKYEPNLQKYFQLVQENQ